ncbi:hypothetical protein V5O48_006475, partial [Marasmius crinis-equi]
SSDSPHPAVFGQAEYELAVDSDTQRVDQDEIDMKISGRLNCMRSMGETFTGHIEPQYHSTSVPDLDVFASGSGYLTDGLPTFPTPCTRVHEIPPSSSSNEVSSSCWPLCDEMPALEFGEMKDSPFDESGSMPFFEGSVPMDLNWPESESSLHVFDESSSDLLPYSDVAVTDSPPENYSILPFTNTSFASSGAEQQYPSLPLISYSANPVLNSLERKVCAVGSAAITSASRRRRTKSVAHKCHYCNSTFTARHNLKNHVNSHLGIRPHICQRCGRRFGTKHVLTRHEKKMCQNQHIEIRDCGAIPGLL